MNTGRSSIFGFTVESDIPFRFTRTGEGERRLQVREEPNAALQQEGLPLFEWKLRDQSGDVTARLYHSDGIYHFWTGDVGWYRIDPAARVITIPKEGDEIRRELRLWGVPAMLCFVELGDVPLHASAVEISGGAILFAAPGKFGKTTLAMAFHRSGYRVLSEDLSCCRLTPVPALLPGPASLRLRPDIFEGQPPHGTTVISIKPDRIFLALDSDRTGDCKPVPIRAIVFLRESDAELRLEPVENLRALPDLWALTFRLKGISGVVQSFSRLSQLATATTIWNLYRPLRMDTLGDVVSLIVKTCSG